VFGVLVGRLGQGMSVCTYRNRNVYKTSSSRGDLRWAPSRWCRRGTIPARLWVAARVVTERAPTVHGLGAQSVRCFASAQRVDTHCRASGGLTIEKNESTCRKNNRVGQAHVVKSTLY